ncbi:TetR/AcrR family transcriptional regulator [soil metagenome]
MRTRLSPDERRAQLIALGVGALASGPLEALTIESLATAAGVSRGLVIHYFDTKDGLHREVVRTACDAMLHATQPDDALEPLDRLHDTLTRLVRFVRDHRLTFHSLVRGAASGDPEVRELVEETRTVQSGWLVRAFLELGTPDSERLRIALRSWVAFAEQTLVDGALHSELSSDELVLFLDRTAKAVVASV